MTKADELAALKAKRDALNAEIVLIEKGISQAAEQSCYRQQLLAINEAHLREGKRQITMTEFMAGVFYDES